MRRYEVWQMEYRKDRYLRYASLEQLEERTFDIVNNSLVRQPNGKIGLLPPSEDGRFWFSRMSHMIEEMEIRGQHLPSIAKYTSEVGDMFQPIPEVEERIAARGLSDLQFIVKLARREHNEDALRLGRIRIGSASSFDNSGYARAIRDRELERTAYSRREDVSILVPGTHLLTPQGGVVATHRAHSDYFMYSFAMSYQRRLFYDFGYDSCLLIHDMSEFADRLIKAVNTMLPSYQFVGKNVGYFDPFRAPATLDVPFNKPFSFEYQREGRFVWIPPRPEVTLKPFFVMLGSLEDVAELVV